MKKFDIPEKFKSGIIGEVKLRRRIADPRKQNFAPAVLDFGNVRIVLPRHFGFCYGVENAIETSYRAIRENEGKRLFLLSEMIHNPVVNQDLMEHGIRFIMDTKGHQLIPWDEITPSDVVIVPAFGTTVEIEELLANKGVDVKTYNTTCPFVEKVWKRSSEIGQKGFSIIIHGKHLHEETRATFSHSYQNAPAVIVRDMKEAERLASYMIDQPNEEAFLREFGEKISNGFDVKRDLLNVGVVNQTTMLATETQAISDFFKDVMQKRFDESWKEHFADTRDTLCYATNDNQESTVQSLSSGADLALVVGGYNSSNTSQIAAILAEKMPAYYISGPEELLDGNVIRHFDYPTQQLKETSNWLIGNKPMTVVITSGASCPDTILEEVLLKLLALTGADRTPAEAVESLVL
jgi:4-hydroxy-3-methylbut-2-enyl diphosphate reductase